ncbi:MAG: DUF362 domain-containing protein [Sedimentisphaerales bacterium]|nr:DUF362 domain-containing protein [Sedimentisphaerales bacterium]
MTDNDKISRRQFLARSAKAGISVAVAAAGAKLLYESDVQNMISRQKVLTGLKDYSVPSVKGQTMSIVSGQAREKTVQKAIDLLGGIGRFVKPGETVLLKPNVAFARPARICSTSHPDIIFQVAKLCCQAGAKKVLVTDNPINNPASCFELSGIAQAAKQSNAEIIFPKDNFFKPITLKGAKLINNWPVLYEPLEKADKVIGIAVVKDHHRSGASMTMKNWYGLLGGTRSIFHTNINTIITELATMMKPTLVILDATQIMISNGPTGGSAADLKQTNLMIAGCDQLAVDSFGATLLEMSPASLPYLLKTASQGIGTTDYQSLNPIFAKVES